jgi:hypothetical protein
MFEAPRSFGRWLSSTGVSHAAHEAMVTAPWLSPSLQTIHILSIAVIVVSAGAICLKLFGAGLHSQTLAGLVRRFISLIWGALTVMLLTGSVLIANRPARYFGNWSFLSKITLIVIAIGTMFFLQSSVRRNSQFLETAPMRAKAFGAGFMLLWIAVIFAGRWIAYA